MGNTLRTLMVGLIAATSLGCAAVAGTPYDAINAEAVSSAITAKPLRGGVVMLEGSGGNMAVLPGPDGLFMADIGIAVSQKKLMAKLNAIYPGPIKYVVNTHWHWDHTDGNAWAHMAGAKIIAQANTAKHLKQTIRVEEWGHTFTPVPSAGRVAEEVQKEKVIPFGGETVRLRYYGPSHTDGDLSLYFTKADVLITGDTWWNGLYPFIDYVAGGSIDGMIKAANANIAMAGESTIVVPGHGSVGARKDLIAYRDMLVAIRGKVAKLKGEGKTLAQAVAAKPTAAYDAQWGKAIINPALFTQLVYRGV